MSQNIAINEQTQPFATIVGRYVVKVFAWMFLGLLLTAITSVIVISNYSLLMFVINSLMPLVIVDLLLVIVLSAAINKINSTFATFMFLVYSIINGLTLSVIFLQYSFRTIAISFGVTALVFGIMSVYGYYTKSDLTQAGKLFIMGLIGVIIATVLNIFLQSSVLEWILCYVGLGIFLGLTAWNVQKIIDTVYQIQGNEEALKKFAIISALSLYLNFINIFLRILRIFGRR